MKKDSPRTDELDPQDNETSEHDVLSPILFQVEKAKNHARSDDQPGAHEPTTETLANNL